MTDHTITLTAQELAAPFKIPAPDGEKLEGPTRLPCIAEGNPPSYTYLKFVKLSEVDAYRSKGWRVSDNLAGTHHGDHAALLVWPHDSEPEA